MPENAVPLQDPQGSQNESASDAAAARSTSAAPATGRPEHLIASRPMLALQAASPPALPPEAYAMIELVGRGLAADADESTRGAARDLWARFGQLIMAAPVMPAAPMMPAAPAMPAAPIMPTAPAMPTPLPPTTPIAMAARAVRQLPPDQLLDLVLQRLRAALPTGATVPTPKGIQFPLVPIPSMPTGDR